MFQLKKYVLEIWRTGSFSQAAANLYVSQPSLSASIKRLEKKLGQPLFDRSVHPVRLTQSGQAYVRAAQSIAAAEEEFESFLGEYSSGQTGTLALGGSNLNISFIVPPVIRRFQEVCPNVQLDILEGNIDDLKQSLLEGRLDLVVDSGELDLRLFDEFLYQPEHLLVAVPASFACNRDLLPYQLSREDILRERHLEPDTPELPLQKLQDVPFVLPTQETDTYKRALRLCQKANFSPRTILSLHQQATVFHINSAGMGAAFISDVLVKHTFFHPDMVYYKTDDRESGRYIKFFKKKGKPITPVMKAFLGIAVET